MYGLTRATLTLIGAAVAGLLLWLATQVVTDVNAVTVWEFWSAIGLIAAAGLTMALSQLLGGWTKWGLPRISLNVFLIAFVPALIVGGWMIAAREPGSHWLGNHVVSWSDDLGIGGFVGDLSAMFPAIAFGIGLVFGFTFDTTGPRRRRTKPLPALRSHPVTTNGAPTNEDRRVRITDGQAQREEEPQPAGRVEDR
jgi:hypothetical protein